MEFGVAYGTTRLGQWLALDRVRSAYLLSYLDPLYASHCRWFEACEKGQTHAALLMYGGLRLPIVIGHGDDESGIGLWRHVAADLPLAFYAQLPPGQVSGLSPGFRIALPRQVLRMTVDRHRFTPLETKFRVETLHHAHTGALMELYRHHPDVFFEPYQLETEPYVGIWEQDALVAVAGVHSVSQQYDIAVIGNIVTHPEHRNRGLSTACTSTLLEQLLAKVSLVALNVDDANAAARRTYEKLGFSPEARFVEGYVERS